jgi:hypothetical protein
MEIGGYMETTPLRAYQCKNEDCTSHLPINMEICLFGQKGKLGTSRGPKQSK